MYRLLLTDGLPTEGLALMRAAAVGKVIRSTPAFVLAIVVELK